MYVLVGYVVSRYVKDTEGSWCQMSKRFSADNAQKFLEYLVDTSKKCNKCEVTFIKNKVDDPEPIGTSSDPAITCDPTKLGVDSSGNKEVEQEKDLPF